MIGASQTGNLMPNDDRNKIVNSALYPKQTLIGGVASRSKRNSADHGNTGRIGQNSGGQSPRGWWSGSATICRNG